MKKWVREFCIRGMMFAWSGPAVLAVVWLCLKGAGELSILTVGQAVLGILSTTFLAFIAAGVTIVYQMENLPRVSAALIQASVLYADYLGIYLLNGWITPAKIAVFSLIFAAGFILIWAAIYIPIRIKIGRMNKTLNRNQ